MDACPGRRSREQAHLRGLRLHLKVPPLSKQRRSQHRQLRVGLLQLTRQLQPASSQPASGSKSESQQGAAHDAAPPAPQS